MELEREPDGTITPSGLVSKLWVCWENSPSAIKYRAQSCILRALFCDVSQLFPNAYLLRDFSYLLQRLAEEGLPFLYETLPLMGKAIETSLVTMEEFITPSGWRCRKGTRLPLFLNSLFRELFEDNGEPLAQWKRDLGKGGRYISDYSDEIVARRCKALTYLKQICLGWSKVEVTQSMEDIASEGEPLNPKARLTAKDEKALDGFVKRMQKDFFDRKFLLSCSDAIVQARRLLRVVFTTASEELDELIDFIENPWGRQGPGAVAGGEVGGEKWAFQLWPGLPPKLFAWSESLACKSEAIERQPPARLCLVPKDFRGPRVICIEPKENQFAQQGLMDILYRLTNRCALSRRSINFLDTTRSRQACYDYRYATIDLKDASDTISLVLARYLLPRWVFKLVTRFRSREIITPTGLVKSGCLATMGNATCFPLETLIFWAIALGSMIALRDSYPLRMKKHLNLDVLVFGDDIIVPLWAADGVSQALTASGLLVNHTKTCVFSPVRESCGEWVFMGRRIKTVKFKSAEITNHRAFVQWLDHEKDLWSSNEGDEPCMPAMHEEIVDQLIRYFRSQPLMKVRWNRNLQRWEICLPAVTQTGKRTELTDAAGLYAWHVRNERVPFPKGARKRVKMGWRLLDSDTNRALNLCTVTGSR